MHNHLKIFGLWIYIVEKHMQLAKDDTDLDRSTKGFNLTQITLCISIAENVYSNIQNIINAKIV